MLPQSLSLHLSRFFYFLIALSFLLVSGVLGCGSADESGGYDPNHVNRPKKPYPNPQNPQKPQNKEGHPRTSPSDPASSKPALGTYEFVYERKNIIYAYDAEIQKERFLLNMESIPGVDIGEDLSSFTLSPNREWIAFLGRRKGAVKGIASNTKDVYAIHIQTRKVNKIADGIPGTRKTLKHLQHFMTHLQWSHDGKFIWFRYHYNGYTESGDMVLARDILKLDVHTGQYHSESNMSLPCRSMDVNVNESTSSVLLTGCWGFNFSVFNPVTQSQKEVPVIRGIEYSEPLVFFGTKILYAARYYANSVPQGEKRVNIWLLDIETGQSKLFLPLPDDAQSGLAKFSKDGKRMVMRIGRKSEKYSRFLYLNLETKTFYNLNIPKGVFDIY